MSAGQSAQFHMVTRMMMRRRMMIKNRTRVQIIAVLVSYFCNLSDFATLKFFSPIWEEVGETKTSIWLLVI